ncbi:hypothetical protein [Rhodococcus koreensis]|nr:hypothetical protein [Rhodococcus koreensis]QSE80823.1 hypothetical protein JWS14_17555 [Rhodococcus koreensis]
MFEQFDEFADGEFNGAEKGITVLGGAGDGLSDAVGELFDQWVGHD